MRNRIKQLLDLGKTAAIFEPENYYGDAKRIARVQYARSIRFYDVKRKRGDQTMVTRERTHNVELIDNKIRFTNNNSGEFFIEVNSNFRARQIYEQATGLTVILKKEKIDGKEGQAVQDGPDQAPRARDRQVW